MLNPHSFYHQTLIRLHGKDKAEQLLKDATIHFDFNISELNKRITTHMRQRKSLFNPPTPKHKLTLKQLLPYLYD